jgi:hypothetical protein
VSATDEPVVFEHAVPIDSVVVDATIPESGEGSVSFALTVSAENHDAVGQQFVDSLRPTSTYGTIDVTESEDTVTYLTTLTGDTGSGDLAQALSEYAPGSSLFVYPLQGGAFTRSYGVDLMISLPSGWVGGGVSEKPTVTATLPGTTIESMSFMPPGSHADGASVTATFSEDEVVSFGLQGTGLKVAVVATTAVIGVVVLAAAAVGTWWILRRRRAAEPSPEGTTLVPEEGDASAGPGPTPSGDLPPVPPPSGPRPEERADAER